MHPAFEEDVKERRELSLPSSHKHHFTQSKETHTTVFLDSRIKAIIGRCENVTQFPYYVT